MVGCLVASFPRRPRVHLQAQHMEHYFPDSLSLIDRCRKVAIEARGPGYLDGDLTVHDAVINYLQGLTSGYTYNWQSCRVYFGQSLTIARIIGLHKVRGLGSSNPGGYSSQFNVNPDGDATHENDEDLVIRELGRRTFWLLFVGVKSVQQFGASSGDFWMPPATPSEPYPPLPLEVDDQYLTPTGILPQPPGVISMLVGFNANVRIYSTYNTLSTMELAYGVDDVFDWDRQKRVLEQSLHAVKQVLEGIPLELQLYPESHPTQFPDPEILPNMNGFQIRPGWERNWEQEQLQRALIDRKKAQYEIQKANIYVSQLSTRSYLVEKYWNLFDAQHRMSLTNHSNTHSPGVFAAGVDDAPPDDDETCRDGFDPTKLDMATEREHIVRDLLSLLGTISQVDIEPNGASFVGHLAPVFFQLPHCPRLTSYQINKVRQIASTLLDVPSDRKGSYAIRAEEYLHAFLNILMKLERSSPMEGDDGDRILTEEEEEEIEFRHWADFRIALNKFVMSGGFANEG